MTTLTRWPLLIAFALTGQLVGAAGTVGLQTGANLPPLEGMTLNGESLALPRDMQGHAAVLVLGFSKAAAKATQPWLENCRSAAASGSTGSAVACYDVRMLEDVPRAFRGMMERGMRSGFPVELQRRTLLVYNENDAWRERVGVVDKKTAYVIGCNGQGQVRGLVRGPFVETELRKLLDTLEPVPPGKE